MNNNNRLSVEGNNCFATAWTTIQHWGANLSDGVSERFGHQWRFYVGERAVLHGLPVAAITALATGQLFGCATIASGSIFGIINYITLTSITEVLRQRYDMNNLPAMTGVIGVSAAIS